MPEQFVGIHNGYEVKDILGIGGLGQVYLVRCLEDNRFYALKVSGADELSAEILHREAQLLSVVEHPAFPDVREIWEEDEHVYLVMTYIEGRTLAEIIEEQLHPTGRGFEADDVLPWMIQLAECLEYLAAQRIVYRDLKLSNVMIDENGKVYLVDFGSACYLGEDITVKGMGTPGFAPPEQYSHSCGPGPWTDIYSFGALLHFLLTGDDPSENLFHFRKLSSSDWWDEKSQRRRMCCRKMQIRRLDRLIERCTQSDPKKRSDWEEVRKVLCFSGSEEISTSFRRIRRLALGGMTVFFLVYGVMTVFYSRLDAAAYERHLSMAETGEQEEADRVLLEAIEQAPENPKAYLLLYDSFMQDGILSAEEWQKVQHLLLENRNCKSGRHAAEWIVLDYKIAMALYLQSEGSVSQQQAADWFQAVADADMKNLDLGEFDHRKFVWQKRAEILGEWCRTSDQSSFRREETEEEKRRFWQQAALLLEDDFYPGEVRWELELYDRILSRVMEEVSVGTKLQIISGADFDAILDRINLGLAKTNNIEKAEAMKQQILDKVYIIKKRLMIGEAAD